MSVSLSSMQRCRAASASTSSSSTSTSASASAIRRAPRPCCSRGQLCAAANSRPQQLPRSSRLVLARAEEETKDVELDPDSESARKKAEADRLRAAERFMVVGTGEATCGGCGYEYTPRAGDPEYPVPPGTLFEDLPSDWGCPVCGAGKQTFRARAREIAGFAENQRYGLGTNSMTGGQKTGLIYGALAFFFALFIAGYFMD